MSDPFRLKTQKAIAAAIDEVSVATGYSLDFTGKVFRGRLIFGEGDPVPMASIIEPPLPNEMRPSPFVSTTEDGWWDIIVQGFVRDDRDNPTDPAHVAMADVKKRLAQENDRKAPGSAFRQKDPFGVSYHDDGTPRKNRIEQFKIGAGVVRPPEEAVSTKAYFWLTLKLKIVEDNSDPFG
ncbi:hypothetical protein G6M86_03455 [Agrobacterium tumefaciens]|uniref:Uncharacterized protein n=1 Tax=Agrobacterium tumefaciens TaxID=358 RepID=A0AAJ4MZI7_AGRTU|nr:hypothetical protein G6M86_03455 [Agrobacterium tumefaciens]